MRLPKDFVESNLKKAVGSEIFGVPLTELSRDELLACVAAGFNETSNSIQPGFIDNSFLNGMNITAVAIRNK